MLRLEVSMSVLLPHRSLAALSEALNEYCEALGIASAAAIIGVSTDTMRRRIRAEQPWFLEEVFKLAQAESRHSHRRGISQALVEVFNPPEKSESHPLLLPSNLREVLGQVGKITTEIAEDLDDGRIDRDEARRLIDLFSELDGMTSHVRRELAAVVKG
jgi:hypothetical protein